jgi:putative tryptophan/tyrosine transport system substrate-binding protein
MRRREFITLLGGAATTWPLAARAQPTERVRRIGVLMLYPENDTAGQERAAAFQQGLEKLGWAVGRNVQIDFQWGLGDADWIRSAAAQLLRLAPDVILANGDAAAKTVQQSIRTVPVIFIAGSDAVANGLVQSLDHPGGNLTGFSVLEPSLGAKLLELLKEIAPSVARRTISATGEFPPLRRRPPRDLRLKWWRSRCANPTRSRPRSRRRWRSGGASRITD